MLYRAPDDGECVVHKDGIRTIHVAQPRDDDDRHSWRFADRESEIEWNRRHADLCRRAAEDCKDDAAYYAGRLSGSGPQWWAEFKMLTYYTRRALMNERKARECDARVAELKGEAG